jgi:hypothetical protein
MWSAQEWEVETIDDAHLIGEQPDKRFIFMSFREFQAELSPNDAGQTLFHLMPHKPFILMRLYRWGTAIAPKFACPFYCRLHRVHNPQTKPTQIRCFWFLNDVSHLFVWSFSCVAGSWEFRHYLLNRLSTNSWNWWVNMGVVETINDSADLFRLIGLHLIGFVWVAERKQALEVDSWWKLRSLWLPWRMDSVGWSYKVKVLVVHFISDWSFRYCWS